MLQSLIAGPSRGQYMRWLQKILLGKYSAFSVGLLMVCVPIQARVDKVVVPVPWSGDEVFVRLAEPVNDRAGSANSIVAARLIKDRKTKDSSATSYRSVGPLILFPSMTELKNARITASVPANAPRSIFIEYDNGKQAPVEGINSSGRAVDRSELSVELKRKYERHIVHGSSREDGSWPLSFQIDWPLVHSRQQRPTYQEVCGPTFWGLKKIDENSNTSWSRLYVVDLGEAANLQPRCRWPAPLSRINFLGPFVLISAQREGYAILNAAGTVAVIDWHDGSVMRANQPVRTTSEDAWREQQMMLIKLRLDPPWQDPVFEKCFQAGFPTRSVQDFWSLADACKLLSLSSSYKR